MSVIIKALDGQTMDRRLLVWTGPSNRLGIQTVYRLVHIAGLLVWTISPLF